MTGNRDTLQKFFDLVGSGDVEGALGLLDPEVVVHEATSLPYGGDFHGPNGFARLLTAVTDLAELELGETELFDAGDTVVARMQATFTSRAHGESLDTEIVELYSFRDGRISDVDVFYKDTHAIVGLNAEVRS